MVSVGIGIITYKRPAMASLAIERVQQLTRSPCTLVVADDGSPKSVVDHLRERARVITGRNRGIAGNKNRALFHLAEVERCDVVLLLEDDTHPTAYGWEEPWIEACRRWGHMNFVGAWKHWPFRGTGTPADPFHSPYISGQCSGFAREAIACVGYLDPRFKAFGWEHVEHTARLARAGYGGYLAGDRVIGLQIESALTIDMSESFANSSQLVENEALYRRIVHEPVYRSPWRDDAEMREFRHEQKSAGGTGLGWLAERHVGLEADYPNVALGKPATQSSVSTWTPGRTPEEVAACGVNGVIHGGKQFHTDHEQNPWWRVDLGAPHRIHEVRVFNALGENIDRARHIAIELSLDGTNWAVAYRRPDAHSFGGADGRPLRWLPNPIPVARHVRLSLPPENGDEPLHLDQVAVFGEKT